MAACSVIGVPPLALAPPELATKQWATLYYIGRARGPTISAAGLLAYLYLAFYASGRSVSPAEGYAYLAAGATTVAVVPYTFVAMMRTNNEIERLAGETEKAAASGDRVKYLVGKWYKLNLVRAVFPLSGFIVGMLALSGYFAE